MGESATALDIQEPSRFNWSLNNKVIIKSPQFQLGTNDILTPYAADGITKRKMNNLCNPQCCLFNFDQPKCGLTPCHSPSELRNPCGHRDTMHSSKPCVPCPFQPNVDLLLCHSGFSVILATFPGIHVSKARLPY